MSRRREAIKRVVLPDQKYESILVTKFINNLMLDGEKSVAESIFYQSMDAAVAKIGGEQQPIEVFTQALEM